MAVCDGDGWDASAEVVAAPDEEVEGDVCSRSGTGGSCWEIPGQFRGLNHRVPCGDKNVVHKIRLEKMMAPKKTPDRKGLE
jgi:hypothetical protein